MQHAWASDPMPGKSWGGPRSLSLRSEEHFTVGRLMGIIQRCCRNDDGDYRWADGDLNDYSGAMMGF